MIKTPTKPTSEELPDISIANRTRPLSTQTLARADLDAVRKVIRSAADDAELVKLRFDLGRFVARNYSESGEELLAMGQIIGTDRKSGVSPFGNGSDETVAISTLLRIAAQLVSASTDLFQDGRSYAAAALLRQLVEIEYLAWAMETKNGDAERWLRSDKKEREEFFKPAKLRKAAAGKFRGQDYGYHCEMGGHPVPSAALLLAGGPEISQLMLSDLLGHAGRIWEHLVGWSHEKLLGSPILTRTPEMRARFMAWKAADPLVDLPPPP